MVQYIFKQNSHNRCSCQYDVHDVRHGSWKWLVSKQGDYSTLIFYLIRLALQCHSKGVSCFYFLSAQYLLVQCVLVSLGMIIKYIPFYLFFLGLAVSMPLTNNMGSRGFIMDLFGGMIGHSTTTTSTTTTMATTTTTPMDPTTADGGFFGFGFGK